MVKWIGSSWKSELASPSLQVKERFYIDFRQIHYPPHTSDLGYTLVTSGDNQPGSHNVTSGHCDYLCSLAGVTAVTVIVRCLPQFAYTVATDQPLWSWYEDANNYLTMYYDAGNNRMEVKWKDGGTERTLNGSAYASDGALQVWQDFAFTFNLSTGAGALYTDRVSDDTTWSGAVDSKTSYFPRFSLRHENSTEGDYHINYVRVLLGTAASAANIANDLRDIKTEEIFWSLNGEGVGRTRCNVTDYVQYYTMEKMRENELGGGAGANTLTVQFLNTSGNFADDQTGAWDPPTHYNGTASQLYLQNKCGISVEHWLSNIFEPIFIGRITDDYFIRNASIDTVASVTVNAMDKVVEISNAIAKKAKHWEDKKLSDATETDSLIHLIARKATETEIKNYVANSSFENATIGNSWAVAGAGATFTKQAGGLFGSNQGDLVYGAATCTVTQQINFDGTKKLNVGEKYTFSVWIKSASAVSNASSLLQISEHDSGGENDNTTAAYTVTAGAGWHLAEVTHEITDSDSDELRVIIQLADNVTLSVDGAMLVQNDRAFKWFVLNDNDGAAGVEDADDADSDTYDTCGFDVDAVNITHPWAVVTQTDTVWSHLAEIANGTICYYMGMDAAGTFKYRSRLKTGYADPSSIETIGSAYFSSINVGLTSIAPNVIIIRGTRVVKNTKTTYVWNARYSTLWDSGLDAVVLNNGETWPDAATYGEFWARYGESQPTYKGV